VIEYKPVDPITMSCGEVEISLKFDHGFGISNPDGEAGETNSNRLLHD
jgi:hypothetical protein